MSRRDYILCAQVIHKMKTSMPATHEDLVKAFVDDFKAAHPTFNADAFRKACGAR